MHRRCPRFAWQQRTFDLRSGNKFDNRRDNRLHFDIPQIGTDIGKPLCLGHQQPRAAQHARGGKGGKFTPTNCHSRWRDAGPARTT